MATKVMVLIAEILMLLKVIRSVNRGSAKTLYVNSFVLMTLALISRTM